MAAVSVKGALVHQKVCKEIKKTCQGTKGLVILENGSYNSEIK